MDWWNLDLNSPDAFVIAPLRPDQLQEARLVIYAVAHDIWHPGEPHEITYARYDEERQLADMEDVDASYFDNGGTFLVMAHGARLIGTGALRRLGEGMGEIKRLYLLPAYHGQGLGYRMMLALLDFARRMGYRTVRLMTDPVYQTRAHRFYRRMGFYPIPDYGVEPDPEQISLEIKLD